MKYLIVMLALVLAGCGEKLHPGGFYRCVNLCDKNDGLRDILVQEVRITCECKNDAIVYGVPNKD